MIIKRCTLFSAPTKLSLIQTNFYNQKWAAFVNIDTATCYEMKTWKWRRFDCVWTCNTRIYFSWSDLFVDSLRHYLLTSPMNFIIIIVHKWWNQKRLAHGFLHNRLVVEMFRVKRKTNQPWKKLLECIKCFKYKKRTEECAIIIKPHHRLFEIQFFVALIILHEA